MREPFDALAEGHISEKNRGGWTAVDVFGAERRTDRPKSRGD